MKKINKYSAMSDNGSDAEVSINCVLKIIFHKLISMFYFLVYCME